MRHFRSILYALVLAPAVWVLAGVGLTRDLTARGRDDFAVESVTGLLLLVLAGAAYAILLLAPISPSGPLLGGLAFLGVAAWAAAAPSGYAGVWPDAVAEDGFDVSRPGYGLAALLALPLIGVALSARRWARYEAPVLPLIGPVGRGRAGSDPTEELHLPMIMQGSDDTTTVLATADAEVTTVLPAAAFREGVLDADDVTPPFGKPAAAASLREPRPEDEEATIAVPTHRDERQTVVVVSPDEAATVAALCDGQASTRPAAAEEAAEAEPAGAEAAGESAEAAGDEGGQELIEAVVVGRVEVAPHSRGVPPELEETRSLRAADPDRTRALQLAPATDEEPDRTRPITVVSANDDEATRPIGESTATVRLVPLPREPDERTIALSRADGDETQRIKINAERTQIIRPGSVEPPGERTQIIRLPAAVSEPAEATPGSHEDDQRDIPA